MRVLYKYVQVGNLLFVNFSHGVVHDTGLVEWGTGMYNSLVSRRHVITYVGSRSGI